MSNRFLLEAKNIIKTFPPTVALNDVHFCLRPGEIHGLMGENGSGKSTMCSIVSGIYPYDSVESFIVANPDLDGVYIACSMGMNILDGTLSALEQYDPDNHIKISVIDFLTGLDTCFEKDRIICAQGGIYIPVQIACGMLEMNAILNGGRLGGQAWDVPISFGAVGSAEEFKDYSKFCEGALPTYTFEELQNLFITYNPDVTGEDIIAWGNAFNLADIYAAHADLAAPVKGPNGVEYVPFAK